MENQLETLRKLVDNFSNNINEYTSSRYDEDNTRSDFIDKLFKILGWDINNDEGLSEDFRDVIREDKVLIEGHSKSPDYAFKYGKQRYFFVEAKKPAVKIKEDNESAFQLRRYGHSAELNLSILTNFKEFAVYDTRIAPNIKDKPAVARIFYCSFEEYEKNWEFIYNLFSKKAIINNSMSRFSTENKTIKGTQPLDKGILNMIENWRKELAENMALKNDINKIRNLNQAVQKIIDRIIFLRIAEDRNTEVYGFLQKLAEQNEVYSELVKYFTTSNIKYNSGLFTVVKWIDNLIIDNKVLKSIIADLYYPNPYEFSVLPIEILGQIYEQFLGRTIIFKRKTKYGHTIEVEEKPEVRKAGGVYYTPQYIVDYIVQNTVGKKIDKQTPKQIEKLTILDPACGSGSFLVGAYKYLLSFHLGYYTEKKRIRQSQKEGKIYLAKKDTYRLSIREKRKILINNIYGVDLDQQAVEVTKLSLLLALMEGEIVEAREELYFKSSNEALLPDLSDNIKWGNSLIGSDFFKDKDQSLFDDEHMEKINCFDWELQFKDIMKSGGFDCVIGNPPYVVSRLFDDEENEYYKDHFISSLYQINLYLLFMELSMKVCNNNGLTSFIVPNTWLINRTLIQFREYLINKFSILQIVDLTKENVFPAAVVLPVIFVLTKNKTIKHIKLIDFKNQKFTTRNKLDIKEIKENDYFINYQNDVKYQKILNKITLGTMKIKEIGKVSFGVKFYQVNKGRPKQTKEIVQNKIYSHNKKVNQNCKMVLEGKDISRYKLNWNGKWIEYGIWLAEPRSKDLFEGDRILMRRIVNGIFSCTFTNDNFCNNSLLHTIKIININYSSYYILGILNSKLIGFYFIKKFARDEKTFPEVRVKEVQILPIKKIDFTNKHEKAQHDRMVNLVEQMLEAQKKYNENKTEIMKQRIDILDKQIDTLVYELYGLTEEEIKIVENG